MENRDRIILALDVPNEAEALSLVRLLHDQVGMFKIGLQLIYSAGISIVQKIVAEGGKVFLDVKLNDIPNTIAGAVEAMTILNVDMISIHAMGGRQMMEAALATARASSSKLGVPRPKILAVTILTSIDTGTLNSELRIDGKVDDQVIHLAKLASESGADGIICSPLEVKKIRETLHTDFITVVPGVRPKWASVGDQRRVATPLQAFRAGATYLVIGRPILHPPESIGSPQNAVKSILSEIERL